MTNSSDESLSDADLTTGDTPTASSMPSDADGTDGGDADGTDGDSTDSTDGDSTDADGTDGGDSDATDG
jgi:hypothetical protein